MKAFKKGLQVLIVCAFLIIPAQVFSAQIIYTFILDGSASLSEKDFRAQNNAISAYLKILNAKAKAQKGMPADWAGVHYFGGDTDFEPIPYYNCSHDAETRLVSSGISRVAHPKYGHTAIYTALAKGTYMALRHEKKLADEHAHVVILITDGSDTNSSARFKKLIGQTFPNKRVFLAVIGVGSGAKVHEFKQYADDVRSIDNFGRLVAGIEATSIIAQKKRTY